MLDRNLFALPGAPRMLAALCLITFLKALAIVGQAWMLAGAIDLLRAGAPLPDAALPLAAFLACFMARQGLVFVQDEALERFAARRVAELREGVLRRVFGEGPLLVAREGTGSTVALVLEGADQVDNYLRLVLPKIAGVLIIPLVILAFAFPVDWVSGLIMLIVFPFILFYMVLLGKTAKAEADRQHDEFNRLANHFVDTLRGLDTLKLFGRSAQQGESVYQASERLRGATMKTLRTAILSGAVLDLFATFSVAAVAIMLGFRLVDGTILFFPALLMLILVPEYFKPIREYASDYHASLDGKTSLSSMLGLAGGGDEEKRDGAADGAQAPGGIAASAASEGGGCPGAHAEAPAKNGEGAGAAADGGKLPHGAAMARPSVASTNGGARSRQVEGSAKEPARRGGVVAGSNGASPAAAAAVPVPAWSGRCVLRARDIAFDYADHRALEGVSFEVAGFSKVGIVGASGSGKSTLVQLLNGFASPSVGGFAIVEGWGSEVGCGPVAGEQGGGAEEDAVPLAQGAVPGSAPRENLPEGALEPDSAGKAQGTAPAFRSLACDGWRSQVACIPQDPYLFHATLRDNIAFYRPDAPDDAIAAALHAVGLEQVVAELPQGLETPIGEGARALSGGQAQRIALARAFLDPSRRILLFDEPTAHLDIETELELKERMLPLMEGRLVFFATHRLHWVRDMDFVLVLEDGQLAEAGAPDDLLARDGALVRLAQRMEGGAR